MWDYGIPSIITKASDMSGSPVDAQVTASAMPGISTLWKMVAEGRKVADLKDASFEVSPQEFLHRVGVPREILEQDLAALRTENVDELQSADVLGYFQKLLEHLIRKYTLKVTGSWTVDAQVCFTELHCPKQQGAVATFTSSMARAAESDFELTVLGVGGGDGSTIALTVRSSLEARDGACYRIVVPVRIHVEKCRVRRGWFRSFDDFLRVSQLEVGKGIRQERILPSCLRCNAKRSSLERDFIQYECDLQDTQPHETAEIEREIEKDRRAKASMKLEVPAIATSLEVIGEVRTTSTIKYVYKLPGGSRYVAYCPSEHPFLYWSVS